MRPLDYFDPAASPEEPCEITQGDLRDWHDEIEGLNDQLDEQSRQIGNLRARLREMIALMEGDIAYGKITAGETRGLLLEQCRELTL